MDGIVYDTREVIRKVSPNVNALRRAWWSCHGQQSGTALSATGLGTGSRGSYSSVSGFNGDRQTGILIRQLLTSLLPVRGPYPVDGSRHLPDDGENII